MCIVKDELRINFSLYEHKKKNKMDKPHNYWSIYVFILTRQLVLAINEEFIGVPLKRRFADSDKQKLEKLLDGFVSNILIAFEIKREQRNKWQVEQQKKKKQLQIKIEEELISQKEFVTIKLVDILGNQLATLLNEEKLSGTYEVNYNGSGLSSGVYFYRNFVDTKKFILMK